MGIIQRLQDVLGLGEYDEVDYDDEAYAEEEDYGYHRDPGYSRNRPAAKNNVVGMPGLAPGSPEVLLMEPRSFEEIPQAVRALRDRKSVVLNLGLMEPNQAQRAADYVAGGAFALDGHQQRLGADIFLFTPSFVQIKNFSAPEPVAAPPTYAPPVTTGWSPESTQILSEPMTSRKTEIRVSPESF